MAHIDVDDLLPNDRVKQSVSAREVTQLTRGASNRYADEGDTFELDGETFEIVGVTKRTLGDFTDADARREGSPSLEAYKQRMERVHPGPFEWDDSDEVITYRFERDQHP
ncbi:MULTISPECIES: ASCH domain-containing protein [Haloferax]|uniref:ASCH domain-containing protein n=1 Tax=Haloferax marinum TaxID=2666143 RepID=A0A6A8GC73_9EURY|nr:MULTISPECIES: ASCH domain-containing protein [Haloferax]KAB1190744.1 ASCH domain-containing protein [Haloferax sp. CBA1150]MRW98282.1 ASCH domain-containing protein [Haloferax marinum]